MPEAGCAELKVERDAYLDLTSTGEIAVTSSRDRLRVQLVDGDREGPLLTVRTTPDTPTYVATTAAATLRVFVKPGAITACRGAGL